LAAKVEAEESGDMGREYTARSLPYQFTIGYYRGCYFELDQFFAAGDRSNKIAESCIEVLD